MSYQQGGFQFYAKVGYEMDQYWLSGKSDLQLSPLHLQT